MVKLSVRRIPSLNLDNVSTQSTSITEKPRRNLRKVLSHLADSVQEHPQNELEKVKRSLRKVYNPNTEGTIQSEADSEKPKYGLQKVLSFSDQYGVQNRPAVPSYMAATESAKAKLKAQGSPRLDQDGIENQNLSRRHSLPASINKKTNSPSPRAQRPIHSGGKGGNKSDRSMLSSRDGNVGESVQKPLVYYNNNLIGTTTLLEVMAAHGCKRAVFVQTSAIVTSVLDGYNVCIFAYGQTGIGKTFTMEGNSENRGVNYQTLEELFRSSNKRSSIMRYELFVSMLEVYNEKIRDLLIENSNQPAKKLEIKQAADGTQEVPGLVEARVYGTDEVWELLKLGSQARSVGSTNANELSSRSHWTKSHLWLVDLAGSERVGRIEVEGGRLKESQFINKSLSALGDVISALASKTAHIPYRNSKLTHMLQSSLETDNWLFEMGLELSLARLKALAKFAFGLGLTKVVLSTLAFTAFELPPNGAIGTRILEFLFHSRPDLVNIRSVDEAIVIGAALSLSSSAFILQNLVEESIWPMLAKESLKALRGLGLLSLGGKYLLRRVFEVVAEARSLEAFLGTFLAGALLAETNFQTQIEADIRPFRGLLLGLFFVTTSTSIDMQIDNVGMDTLMFLGQIDDVCMGSTYYHNDSALPTTTLFLTDNCLKGTAICQILGFNVKGWCGRLVFSPSQCLIFPAPKPFFCCVVPAFHPIFVPLDVDTFDVAAPNIAMPSSSLSGPSGLSPPPKILQGNTMTNSIVEVFKQATVRLQDDLLNVLKSKDFHDHESMILEACFIFCALDALFVDSQPFKEQAEEFIGCAA
ncbi:unnamed protein product [Camellia sinensis]